MVARHLHIVASLKISFSYCVNKTREKSLEFQLRERTNGLFFSFFLSLFRLGSYNCVGNDDSGVLRASFIIAYNHHSLIRTASFYDGYFSNRKIIQKHERVILYL